MLVNYSKKNKNVDQLFKEIEPVDEKDKSPATYYYTKVNGDGSDSTPGKLDLQPIKPDTKVDEIYNQMKTKGGVMKKPEDDDGIQIFKIVGEADNKDIDEHIKEAGDRRKNRPGENGKLTPTDSGKKRPDLPVKGKDGKDLKPLTDFGEYKIYGNKLEPELTEGGIDEDCAVSKVLGKGIEKIDNGDDDLECIKVSGDKLAELAKPENNKKVNQISNLFKEADDDKEGANYYYRKVLGGTADRPGEERTIN